MLPIIYTPTVGDACEHFSDIYRSARGIFVSYDDRDYLDEILRSVTKDKVKVVVVTDGERVLGLGDQVGGMGIAIGKLSLYTACGGISRLIRCRLRWMWAQITRSHWTIQCTWVGGLRESALLNTTHLLMVSSTLCRRGGRES